MEVVWLLAAWGALVAAARCSLNTASELRLGREALRSLRQSQPQARVFGGFATYVSLYPYAAYLLVLKPATTLACSATIVAPKWTLTAAHCVRGTGWQGIMFAGDVDYTTDTLFTKINVQIRIVRETFDYTPPEPDQLKHDIVVLELWREFRLERDYVTAIPLTEETTLPADFRETCTIVGFGQRGRDVRPTSGVQRAASFLTEHGESCGRPDIKENGLCTLDVEKKSSCKGDSGGPVFCAGEQVLVGIIAGGRYKNCSEQWCGAPMTHNYHMFVGYYRAWILRLIQPGPGRGWRRASGSGSGAPLPGLNLLLLSYIINAHPPPRGIQIET